MKRYKYKDCAPIRTSESTVWIVEYENGNRELHVWCKEAKIEDVVKAIKIRNCGMKFTVGSIDVGEFKVKNVDLSYMKDARKLNQNMRMVIPGDPTYDFSKKKKVKIKRKKYKDIPH